MMMKIFNPIIWLIISLTLGLAPFSPEPHIVEKIRWILDDMSQLSLIDWFDFLMHGTPWVMLVISIILSLNSKQTQ